MYFKPPVITYMYIVFDFYHEQDDTWIPGNKYGPFYHCQTKQTFNSNKKSLAVWFIMLNLVHNVQFQVNLLQTRENTGPQAC